LLRKSFTVSRGAFEEKLLNFRKIKIFSGKYESTILADKKRKKASKKVQRKRRREHCS
jgi:hypothetical protein